MKPKIIELKIGDIKAEWDVIPMDEILTEWSHDYDWSALVKDIKKNGLKELIEVVKYKESWLVVDGQHRIRAFKHLNPPDTTIKVIQKSRPCNL
jgi:hypothetical protein